MRFAIVSLNNSRAEQIARYLPDNYRVVGYAPHDKLAEMGDLRGIAPCVVIGGEDKAGWTLDDYVIPRLASGVIGAMEIPSSDPVLRTLDEEDERRRVKLIQSYRFPNVWSLEDTEGENLGIWRDTMFANGAISSEGAMDYAHQQDWRIIEVVSQYWDEGPVDPRNQQRVDTARDCVEGYEYRTQRKALEPLLYQPIEEVTDNG